MPSGQVLVDSRRTLLRRASLEQKPEFSPRPAMLVVYQLRSLPENTSSAPTTGVPAFCDKTSGKALRRTRRTWGSPALRSACCRKDVPELLPDRRDTRTPLAVLVACAFPLPWQDTILNHRRRKVIKAVLVLSLL